MHVSNLEGCGLLSVQGPYHLWKGGRCHLMECKVVPVLDTVAGRFLCSDGLPMLSMQRSGLWVLWYHVWSRVSSGHFRSGPVTSLPVMRNGPIPLDSPQI